MAATEVISNFGITTIGTTMSSSTSTSLTVAALVGALATLGTNQQCRVTLGNTNSPSTCEIVIASGAPSGKTFTITRGAEGTSANQQAWPSTTPVSVALTAGGFANALLAMANATDQYPVAQLTSNGLSVGQGGSSAVSSGIASGGANTLAFTNGSTTNWATLTSSTWTWATGVGPMITQAAPATVSSGNGTSAQNTTFSSAPGGSTTAANANGGSSGNFILNIPAGGSPGSGGSVGGQGVYQMQWSSSGRYQWSLTSFATTSDNVSSIGSSAARWSGVSAINYRVFANAGDSQPGTNIFSGTILLGVGGSTVADVSITRTGTSTLTIANNSATNMAAFSPTLQTLYTNLNFSGFTTATSATAGSASALPGVPLGYLQGQINGTNVKFAYWAM
jgi:hypothetical protein